MRVRWTQGSGAGCQTSRMRQVWGRVEDSELSSELGAARLRSCLLVLVFGLEKITGPSHPTENIYGTADKKGRQLKGTQI